MSHSPNQISARLTLEMWAKHRTNAQRSSVWRAVSKNLSLSPSEAHLSVTLLLGGMDATHRQIRHLRQWYRLHGACHVEPGFCVGVPVDLDTFRMQVEMEVEGWFENGQVREVS